MRFRMAIFKWNETVFMDHALTQLRRETERFLQILRHYNVERIIINPAHEVNLKEFERSHLCRNFETMRFGAYDHSNALFQMLLQHQVDPHNAFYVDNAPDDLAAAKKLGITTFGIGENIPQHRMSEAYPDHVVMSPMEIIPIFRANLT